LTIYKEKNVVEKPQRRHKKNMEMGDEATFGDDD
jgi:hypothetical protein